MYSKFFNEKTTARHIVFSYSLLKAVQDSKTELFSKKRKGIEPTQSERDVISYFEKSGSIYLLTAAVADSLETILGRAVPNKFAYEFASKISATSGAGVWQPILQVLLPLTGQMLDGFTNDRISSESTSAIGKFRALVGATAASNRGIFKIFAAKVKS